MLLLLSQQCLQGREVHVRTIEQLLKAAKENLHKEIMRDHAPDAPKVERAMGVRVALMVSAEEFRLLKDAGAEVRYENQKQVGGQMFISRLVYESYTFETFQRV